MRSSLLLWLCLCTSAAAQLAPEPSTVRIGVLSLFHPQVLVLSSDHPMTLLLDGEPYVLDARQQLTLRANASRIATDLPKAQGTIGHIQIASTRFTLGVPGKLKRSYLGALSLRAQAQALEPVIAVDTEIAVSSIVAAESPPQAPPESAKAQAVAARSFLLAAQAHADFDACDTTHCQFLRSPPSTDSPAASATRATRGMVLTWRDMSDASPTIVAARYARSCGGQTRVPGHVAPGSYPFYSVRCAYCSRHPELWTRVGPPATATEQQRLAWNRIHGWQSIPSNTSVNSAGVLEGRGTGHGVGLCQLGAADLARRGLPFAEILSRYFPDTTLATLP